MITWIDGIDETGGLWAAPMSAKLLPPSRWTTIALTRFWRSMSLGLADIRFQSVLVNAGFNPAGAGRPGA